MQTVQAILTYTKETAVSVCLSVCMYVPAILLAGWPDQSRCLTEDPRAARLVGRMNCPIWRREAPSRLRATPEPRDPRHGTPPGGGSGRSPRTQTPSAVGGIPYPRSWGELARNPSYEAGDQQEKTTLNTGDDSRSVETIPPLAAPRAGARPARPAKRDGRASTCTKLLASGARISVYCYVLTTSLEEMRHQNQ